MKRLSGRIRARHGRSRLTLLVAVSVAGVLAAACGSTSSSTSSGSGGSSGSSAASSSSGGSSSGSGLSGQPIKIGAIVSESGSGASAYVVSANVFNAWGKWTNAHGGINGHPVDVIVLDDQSNPATGLADAQKLIQADHVIAIAAFDNTWSGWTKYVGAQHVPIMGPSYLATPIPGAPRTDEYITDSGVGALFAGEMSAGKELGASKLGSIDIQQGGDISAAYKAAAGAAGVTFVKSTLASATAPSFVSECLAVSQAGADGLIGDFGSAQYKQVVDQCYGQGFRPVVLGLQPSNTWLSDPAFTKSAAVDEGFPWFDTTNPAIANFSNALNQYAPGSLTGPNANPVEATEAWITPTVIKYAAEQGHLGNNATPQQLITGLNTVDNNTFGNITSPLTYKNGGNLNPPNCTYIVRPSGSHWVVGNGGKQVCITAAQTAAIYKALP